MTACKLQNLVVYEYNGSIFQNFPKFEPKLAQILKKFGTLGWFCSKLKKNNLGRLVYE